MPNCSQDNSKCQTNFDKIFGEVECVIHNSRLNFDGDAAHDVHSEHSGIIKRKILPLRDKGHWKNFVSNSINNDFSA